MHPLLALPLRYLFGRKLRTGLTTLAVVFGVAVIFGVNILLPTLVTALDSGVLGVTGQVDLTVSGAAGETFDAGALDVARSTGGVGAAAPALRRPVTLPGAPVAAGPIELLGIDPAAAALVRPYQVTAGRFLGTGDGRVAVLSQPLAAALSLRPGDTLALPTPQGLTPFAVAGVVAAPGALQIIIPLPAAQTLFAVSGRINTIDLALRAGADRARVQTDLLARLGAGYRVGSVALQSAAFANLQIGLVAGDFFGLLTLFMGAFLIFNTFRTIAVERQNDIGMLRAVGATRPTIIALLIVESTLQGVVGTLLGLLLGYLLALGAILALAGVLAEFLRLRLSALTVTPDALALAVVLGIGVTVGAGLVPALTASRVPVIQALRPPVLAPAGRRPGRSAGAGAGLLGLALLSLLAGDPTLVGLGALLFLAGLVALTPALIDPLARIVEPLLGRLFAREGLIAVANLRRQPGRAAATIGALMIGLTIVVALSGVFASIEQTFSRYLDRSLSADILLLPPALATWSSDVGAGPAFERQFAAIPGIGRWAGLRYAAAQADGVGVQVLGIDQVAYPQVATLLFDQGDPRAFAALGTSRVAIANTLFASAHHVQIGDTVQVATPAGPQPYRIAAIAGDYLAAKINTLYISQANLTADFHTSETILVFADLAPGADPAQVQAGVARLLAGYPQFTLTWGADLRATQHSLLGQSFLVLYAALFVLIIPSLLGLINTLAIGVLERTREIGVLRAIGATRGQVRRVVLAEALLLGAAGAVLGLLGGLVLGYALTALTAAAFTNRLAYSFPFAGLLLAGGLALLMALLASLLPARQAAHLRIIDALQYE